MSICWVMEVCGVGVLIQPTGECEKTPISIGYLLYEWPSYKGTPFFIGGSMEDGCFFALTGMEDGAAFPTQVQVHTFVS